MLRRQILAGLAAAATMPAAARAAAYDGAANAEDLAWLIDKVADRYAYLPDRHLDLARLRRLYVPKARAASDRSAFLAVLEAALAELHDHHVGLNTNNYDSPQLVPTGTEVWASVRRGRAMIDAVRRGGELDKAGVWAGMEVTTIGGRPALEAVAAHAPRALKARDPEADDYTLRVLLAGTHRARRIFRVSGVGIVSRDVDLPPFAGEPDRPLLAVSTPAPGIVCLRPGNSLGDSDLVAAFDAALETHRDAKGLILDLRDTPSGGDTDVAEPILGRFIAKRQGYQRFLDPGPGKTLKHDSWVREVDPRGPIIVTTPLVVLVDRWTGSMGEGMAIGLDAMKRATVVGTRMAGLCGATEHFELPHSAIGVSLPTERLYHLNGTPRERWTPPVFVFLANPNIDDPILKRGLSVLAA